MLKVVCLQQVYNSRKWLDVVYPAMVNQTYPVTVVAQIVADDGGCEEYIRNNFPQIIIEKPGYNIGFAKGHNVLFDNYPADLYQLVNPDLVMELDYIEHLVAVFSNPKVGAATGKLFQYNLATKTRTRVIDSTGVNLAFSGKSWDRGQHEEDKGQYDSRTILAAVSGAGAMYRKTALESVRFRRQDGAYEYFDEDFHSYWEDVDLGLRMRWSGFECVFEPKSIAGHGRSVGSSKKSYFNLFAYTKHHNQISLRNRQLNFKNHWYLILKNLPYFKWQLWVREIMMFGYLVLIEPKVLCVIPEFLKGIKIMLQKRKIIFSRRVISAERFESVLIKNRIL